MSFIARWRRCLVCCLSSIDINVVIIHSECEIFVFLCWEEEYLLLFGELVFVFSVSYVVRIAMHLLSPWVIISSELS